MDRPGSVYYDVTWVGYLGREVPAEVREDFCDRGGGA